MAMGPLMILNASNILFFLVMLIFKQFFNSTAAALVVQLQLQLQFCICLYFESHDSDFSKPCPC